jgi:ABC-2 type transport system ATP-binding protein
LLREAGLWDARARIVGEYSAGMKQKLSLCAALLHDPKVLVVDEPFTAFDYHGAQWGRAALRARASEGAAILFSSHDPALVQDIATRVILIEEGLVIDAPRPAARRDA